MTYDEYSALIGSMTTENFQAVGTNLLQGVKEDCETITSLTEKIAGQDTKIRDLQDTNAKLFLSITSPASKVEDSETAAEKAAEAEIEAARAMRGISGLF